MYHRNRFRPECLLGSGCFVLVGSDCQFLKFVSKSMFFGIAGFILMINKYSPSYLNVTGKLLTLHYNGSPVI